MNLSYGSPEEGRDDHTVSSGSAQASPLRVAILHHHLRSGGVTTVIRGQVAGLGGSAECLLLSGEPAERAEDVPFPAGVSVIPDLGYDEPGVAPRDGREIAGAVRQAMTAAWGCPADVLHVHNPLLCRNAALASALRILRDQGIPLFLQVHDFPEDGRPHAYTPAGQYVEDCHYGVVSSRDRDALLAAGLKPEGVHLVPNPVHPARGAAVDQPARAYRARRSDGGPLRLLYPVRGIRRKNIGEALLLALIVDGEVSLTLPPRDRAELSRWEEWRSFARERGLRASFGAGLERPLLELMRESHWAISTSLNEGFGFSFLEPWTAGLGVAGRRIAHVAADFEAAGIRFPHVYRSLSVPAASFDSASCADRWKEALAGAVEAYGRRIDEAAIQRASSALFGADLVDFGCLDEAAQRQTLLRAEADPRLARDIESAIPELADLRNPPRLPDPGLVERNRGLILAHYGPDSSAEKLRTVYRAVVGQPIRQSIDRAALLDQFLRPERFRMLEQR